MPNVKTSITEKKKLMTKTYNSDLSRYLKEKNIVKRYLKNISYGKSLEKKMAKQQ